MKVTLEREDLIRILRTALGYAIEDEDIEVQADPFEVHIRRVQVDELAKQATPSTPPVPPVDEYEDNTEDDEPIAPPSTLLTMEEVLRRNEELGGPRLALPPNEERMLGFGESEVPPLLTKEELYGKRKRI